jgi:alkanesulfonate monooxygenase SsuD/methylene tetrahydromethanopterin reductase-like flavin-dependent oxidoreductase (luciferase family)
MIIGALETGVIEGSGPFYPQVRTEIRPRPLAGFADRFYCVGLSPEAVEQAAALGATLMTFTQQPWEMYASGALADYRAAWSKHHSSEAPFPLTGDLMFCDASADRAEELAREYMANYFLTIVNHYELMSEHFKDVRGYDLYANAAELFRQVGLEPAVQTYVGIQTWGTPRQILEKLEARKQLLGGFETLVIARYGGMSGELAEASLRLFAEQVLPELKSW